jgi:predicted DNA-binding WGR domain protein
VSAKKVDEKVLYCRDLATNTDKEYHAVLMSEGGRYLVFFMWGRRGKKVLQRGETKAYASEARARDAIEVQLRAKRKEGYFEPGDAARKMRADIKAKQRAQLAEAERLRLARAKPRRVVRRSPVAKLKPQSPAVLGGTRRIKLDD